jgi:hypothetical protein
MFKPLTINLTGPICACAEQSLGCFSHATRNDVIGFLVYCKVCKCELFVPDSALYATFKLDAPYPGKKQESKPPLNVLQGGKVIDMQEEKNKMDGK